MSLPSKTDLLTVEWLSIAAMVSFLVLTAVSIFVWMAIDGMTDMTGISVAVLFIVLAVSQIVFALFWWRAKQKKDLYRLRSSRQTNDKYAQERNLSINKDREEESRFIEKPRSTVKQE